MKSKEPDEAPPVPWKGKAKIDNRSPEPYVSPPAPRRKPDRKHLSMSMSPKQSKSKSMSKRRRSGSTRVHHSLSRSPVERIPKKIDTRRRSYSRGSDERRRGGRG